MEQSPVKCEGRGRGGCEGICSKIVNECHTPVWPLGLLILFTF